MANGLANNTTKTFESLKTKDKAQATRLLLALNEAGKQPAMNLGLDRVYLKHSDPMVSQRTWQHVLDEIIKLKTGPTQYRWQSAAKDKAFDLIRNRLLIETQAEHFLAVLKKGTVPLRFVSKKRSLSCCSNPSSVRLAKVGEMIPPCGVPAFVGKRVRFSTNPALIHWRSILLSVGMFWSIHP